MHLSHLLRGVATTFPPSTPPLSSDITPLQGSKHKASWMLERFFTEPRGHGLREVFRSPVRAPRWTLNKKSHGFLPLQYYYDDTWSTYRLFNPHKNPGGGCKQPHTCVCYSLCTIAIYEIKLCMLCRSKHCISPSSTIARSSVLLLLLRTTTSVTSLLVFCEIHLVYRL